MSVVPLGFVFHQRVLGELAVSRSIGDADFKDENSPVVIAHPEVEHTVITPGDDFLLLACDGVWDVMSNQDAVEFLLRALGDHNDLERALKQSVHRSITELSSTDNVSMLIVAFRSKYSQL